jgi:signal transduction histidine kinase
VSLRWRLLVGLAVLVLVAVASSGWLVLQVARARLAAAQLDGAQALGAQLAALLQKSAEKPETLAAACRALVESGAVVDVAVVDDRGQVTVGDPRASGDGALVGARSGAPFVVEHAPFLDVYAPLGAAGAARLRLRGDDQLASALAGARALLLAVTLIDVGLVLLFGALFIRRVVGPLEALAQAARRVGEGQLDGPPLPVTTRGDEMARLTDGFNQMTRSLREQRETLREQRETLVQQEKLATVGRLAAGVAHEVGNPLAAVLGYAELLIPTARAEDKEMLERIRKETERIRGIVAGLLDYSRPVTGAVEPVRLRGTVEAAATLLKPQARFRDVVVQNCVDETLTASANDSRLLQVLINLFLNAADAMGARGTITVEGRLDGERVELSVSDEGPGIAPENRGKIFDPFFTTKDPGQGTGLGLAVSRSIVEAYGGELRLAESERGARFVLTLATP